MATVFLALAVIQSIAISLGVGASTVAVFQFFNAIKDGTISVDERNFMGVTYLILRIAMVIILVSTLILFCGGYFRDGLTYFTAYKEAQLILIAMLFINAYLMTKHLMPSSFGPAIQASSWYTLGFLLALAGQGLDKLNILIFILSYVCFIFLMITIFNSEMAYLKEKREEAG